jgi:nitroimidazol reductase NimA-like FMN-containing flavoprotein (pyridoxamine 5'-phosphate oxidase superfamily)
MMRANPSVCVEVDEYAAPGRWRSAILQGTYEEVEGDEKAATLEVLKQRFAQPGGSGARRPESHERESVCFRIRVREATGRAVER